MMATITASTGTQQYRTEIKTATHTLIADEPESLGGGDLGPTPDELLAAALGACTGATLRMYADRKGWKELEGTTVTVALERNAGSTAIRREITLLGPLSEAQRVRLLEIANRCPVHRTLSQNVAIDTTLH